jgi:hypothetical protein
MKYIVQTPLMKDGQRIEAGEDVDLAPKDAKELLACGAIANKPKKDDAEKK